MEHLNPALDDDSEDLSLEEVQTAVIVPDLLAFNRMVAEWAREVKGLDRKRRYELRRWKPHMYCRVAIGDGPDKVSKLFRVDWFQSRC